MTVQAQVDKVGIALLNRMDRGRPSFNAEATGMPTISGVAQVGAELTVNTDAIRDVNDIPVDDDGDEKFNYQWLRDGEDIPTARRNPSTPWVRTTMRRPFRSAFGSTTVRGNTKP